MGMRVLLRTYNSSIKPARSKPVVEPRAPMAGEGAKWTAPLLYTGSVGRAVGMVMFVVGLRVLDVEVDMAEDSELVLVKSYFELIDILEEVEGTASAVEEVMIELEDIACVREVLAEELAIELDSTGCIGELWAEELGMVGIIGVLAGGTYWVWLAGRLVEEDGVMV